MHPVKDLRLEKTNCPTDGYTKKKEASAIKKAEEQGYFFFPDADYLWSQFGTKSAVILMSWKDQKDLQKIAWIILRHMRIRDITTIGQCTCLRICDLGNNYIENIQALALCFSLVKLDLHANRIVKLPSKNFWQKLNKLRLLYLHDNPIGKLESISNLSGCSKLVGLTLFNTPVCLMRQYRHHTVNSVWSLKVLDSYMVSDEEIIEDANFTGIFSTFHHRLYISLLITSSKETNCLVEMSSVINLLQFINNKQAHTSPVLIIQKLFRGHMVRKRYPMSLHLATLRAINKIGPRTGDIKIAVLENLSSSRRNLEKVYPVIPSFRTTITIDIAAAEDHIMNLMETEKSESKSVSLSISKRQSKLGILIKRIRKSINKRQKQALDKSLQSRDNDNKTQIQLTGTQKEISDDDKVYDIMLTILDSAEEIRSAKEQFHESKYKASPETRQYQPIVTACERLYNNLQKGLNLTPFLAVEQAYKKRNQITRQLNITEAIHKAKLTREIAAQKVLQIRDRQRAVASNKEEQDRISLHKALSENAAKNNDYILLKRHKLNNSRNNLRSQRNDKIFSREFSTKNNSVGYALQKHDQIFQRENEYYRKQERVHILKSMDDKNKFMVKKYLNAKAESQRHENIKIRSLIDRQLQVNEQDRMIQANQTVERVKTAKALATKDPEEMPLKSVQL